MPISDSGEHANVRTVDPTYKSFPEMQAIAKVSNKYRFHILNTCKYALNTSYVKDYVISTGMSQRRKGVQIIELGLGPKYSFLCILLFNCKALTKPLNVY